MTRDDRPNRDFTRVHAVENQRSRFALPGAGYRFVYEKEAMKWLEKWTRPRVASKRQPAR